MPAAPARDAETRRETASERSLRPPGKAVYALGDLTANLALSALSLVYASYYLTQVADLRPALAGLVPLIARGVDAFADPLVGRLSDATTWRAGRRRPYFLIGAVPFGAAFALLWWDLPVESQAAKLAYYTTVYTLTSVAMSVLSVPYLALIPEMALGYDARTSLNTYRNAGAVLGTFAAIGIRPTAEAFGGGGSGFLAAGAVYGVILAVPWLFVHRVSFERPGFQGRGAEAGFGDALKTVFKHRTFSQLTALYLFGRIAMDLVSALVILYMTYWIGRSADFEPLMAVFLTCVLLALPFWLRLARHRDKAHVFLVGSLMWATVSLLAAAFGPETPRWVLFAWAAAAAMGYAVVDLMPWSMVGDVIDEDDLAHGERREGLYNGVFTFLRKLGGALGVMIVMSLLDLAGFARSETQSATVQQAIRWLTALAPCAFLLVGAMFARGYPLGRAAHARIVEQLDARDRARLARTP
ncbi:MAG TPA: glycoside-pentoside-hexuronide (GPH):cation symporter [Myxococcota bacterium]|nr:glycoside-pentoside-hexuronide (GPH):cation symporter [Myxococcota bacterium]